MIKCPHCGGEMDFVPGTQLVTCEYCKSEFEPTKLNTKVKTAKERKNPNELSGKSYTCSQCGATLMTFDDTAITFCSYCGSQAMIEEQVMNRMKPDFVIPFSKTKEDCIKEYKRVIKSNKFVPDYMKDDMVIEKFRGIYMPYVLYDLEFHGNNTSKGSKYAYRKGDYVYYNDFHINADLDVKYDGLSFDLSSNYFDRFSSAIPFNSKERKEFNPNYLVGFYADSSNVENDIYDEDAKKVASADARKKLIRHSEYTSYNCTGVNVDLEVADRKIGFFPVYFLAIRDKSNQNVSYAVVNGQTGKIAVDLPVAFKKYIIFSLIVSAIIFVLINSFVVLTPEKIVLYAAMASILSLFTSISQARKIKKRTDHSDDKGYSFVNYIDEEKKEKFHYFKYVYKEILGIVIPLLIYASGLANDAYYYGAAIISLVLVLLSFKDLVTEHNLLTTSKLPQLEKRGGDK